MSSISARRVLTATGWAGPSEIAIDDHGTIESITPTDRPTPDVSLVPGFVDVQVNGIDDIDVATAVGDDWTRLSDLLLDHGVTSWCPTLVINALDRFALPLERIASERAAGPSLHHARIIGAHLEGPFLGGAPGAHPRHLLAPIDMEWLRGLPDVVRLVTLAAELELAPEATAQLAHRGVVVSIGHSTPSLRQTEAVIAAGATMATHLFNGMSGVHHRDPGLAATALVDDRLAVGLIADLVHVHPLAIQLAFRSKPADKVVIVTDAVGWRIGTVGEVGMERRDGAARLADGTLAGSIVTMDAMVRNLVDVCGISLAAAVRAASSNPAAVMGCADRGVIEPGRRADLVALDDTMHVAAVWLDGIPVRGLATSR